MRQIVFKKFINKGETKMSERKEYVKEFSGKILGSLEYQGNGDVVARNFAGQILGYYRKSIDSTTNFAGRILYSGDCTRSLVVEDANKKNH